MLGANERILWELPSESKMAHWRCLYPGQCAAEWLMCMLVRIVRPRPSALMWPAGAAGGADWVSQPIQICNFCPLQGGGLCTALNLAAEDL